MALAAAAEPIKSVIHTEAFHSPGRHPERIQQHCRETGQAVPGDPGSICRVILQSLAARYKEVLETIESLTGRRIEVIHIRWEAARKTGC